MEVINLTPHDVQIVGADGAVVATYPRSGRVARVATTKEDVGSLDGIEIKRVSYGAIQIGDEPLPEPSPDENSLGGFHAIYIVSIVVAQAAPARNDLIYPDTSPDAVVRDANGQIIGVRNFAKC